jgi:uncharacterized protein (TIGR02145 family)
MILTKTLLTGLVGVSLCMADISGIVTDTGGATPIPGAVVRLENGGQTAITGIDGSFTLIVNNAILPGNGKLSPNALFAGISGNRLNVTIAERAAIEVATFNLNGKALSTVRTTLDAGSHSIALPQRGAGVYLCRVKAGNKEFVLKGNSIDGVSQVTSQSVQGNSSNITPAKQVMKMAAINDVIAATKTGYLNYRVVATNSDTSGIAIKMIVCADSVTDADGNVYQAVKIGNQVWMAENLRVTKYNDESTIPFDTSSATWYYATTPKFCYYNNTTNADSNKKFGALYNWYTVSPANPKKIAPTGWHVPSDSEWTVLEKYLVLNGYNWDGTIDTSTYNTIAKSLAAKMDWWTFSDTGTIGADLTKNNRSGFSALPGGCRSTSGGFDTQGFDGYWWSATKYGALYGWSRDLSYDLVRLYRSNYDESCGFSIRLLRDN